MYISVAVWAVVPDSPRRDDRWIDVTSVHNTEVVAQESQARHGGRGRLVEIHGTIPDHPFFQVTESTDQTEGRGLQRKVVVMTSFREAVRIADRRGSMGFGHGQIQLVETTDVFDTAEDFWRLAGSQQGLLPKQPEGIVLLGALGLSTVYFTADPTMEPLIEDPDWADYVRRQNKFGADRSV